MAAVADMNDPFGDMERAAGKIEEATAKLRNPLKNAAEDRVNDLIAVAREISDAFPEIEGKTIIASGLVLNYLSPASSMVDSKLILKLRVTLKKIEENK